MQPEVRELTEQFIQAMIGVRRAESQYSLDQFQQASTEGKKAHYAFRFGSLTRQIEQLEFILCLFGCVDIG